MEGQLFGELYLALQQLCKLRFARGRRGQVYRDIVIVAVLLWAALHDRPISWACRGSNWYGRCPFDRLPSCATMSRRLKSLSVLMLLGQLLELFNDQIPASAVFGRIDAHPMPVGGASKDRDAKAGFGAGRVAKGYKLHEMRSGQGHLDAWVVSAMADREPVIAPRLLELARPMGAASAAVSDAASDAAPSCRGCSGCSGCSGYLVGDNGYDTNALYAAAAQHQYQLLAPPRPSAKAHGHQRHHPARYRGLELSSNPLAHSGQAASFGQQLISARKEVERDFAHEVTAPCGLTHLPPWVRRPRRVARWTAAKLTIHLAYLARFKNKSENKSKNQKLRVA